jgi:hypothetical protein
MSKRKTLTPQEIGLVNNPDQHIPEVHSDSLGLKGLAKLKLDVVYDRQVPLDHAKAVEYLDLPTLASEREVVDAHVQFLLDEMRRGTFNPLLVVLSTVVCDGKVYKLNGQHVCWAVLFMPEGFSVEVREIRYRCTNEEQMKQLYATYDRLRARNDAHLAKIFLVGTEAVEGVWPSTTAKLALACKFWLHGDEKIRRRVSPDQLSAQIQRECPQVFRQVGLFHQTNHEIPHMRRTPILAAMFATFQKLPTKAAEFWQPVADGLELTAKTDPRWVLRDMLLYANSRTVATKKRRVYSTEDVYGLAIVAWNKWRRGEKAQMTLRVPSDRPKPI